MNNGTFIAHSSLISIQEQMKLKYDNKRMRMGKYNLLYLNINSLRHKEDELENAIHDLQNNSGKIVHFVALTETRIKELDIPLYNLPNYASFHCTRGDGYGGCALFVRESLTCNLIEFFLFLDKIGNS